MVSLNHHFSRIRVCDRLRDISACQSLLQALNGLLPVHESLDLHKRNVLALAAVHFPDNNILGNIHQTSGQITGVSRTQSRVGQTFSGAVGGDKALQYIQSLAEIGLNGKLNSMSGGICHQTAHACQLFDLFIGTTSSGVSHHKDVVVLVKAGQKVMGQLVVRSLPGLDHFLVPLLFRDQTSSKVLGDSVHRSLRIGNQLRLAGRNRHIRDGNGHGRSGRVLVTNGLNVVQSHRRLGRSVYIDNLLQNLLALFLSNMEINFQKQLIAGDASVHKPQILGNDLIENKTANRGFDNPALYRAVRYPLLHSHLHPGVESHSAVFIGQDRLVGILKAHPFPFGPRPLLGQIIDAQNHILRRHRHRAAVGRLQQVVGGQEQEPALCLGFHGKRQMDRHLIPVKVGVKGRTY